MEDLRFGHYFKLGPKAAENTRKIWEAERKETISAGTV